MRKLCTLDSLQQRPAQLHRVERRRLVERLWLFKVVVVTNVVVVVAAAADLDGDDRLSVGAGLFVLASLPLGVVASDANVVILTKKKLL